MRSPAIISGPALDLDTTVSGADAMVVEWKDAQTCARVLSDARSKAGYASRAASRSVEFLLQPGDHTKYLIEYLREAKGLAGGQATQRAERRGGE